MLNHPERITDSSCAVSEGNPIAEIREPQVSGVMLRMLADVAAQHGVAPQALLWRESRKFLTQEPIQVRLPLFEFRRLLVRAIDLSGEPGLGLRCGLYASESAFDLFAPLVAHVRSLRHAIGVTQRFQELGFEGLRIRLTEGGGVARLSYAFPRAYDHTDRILAEFFSAGLMRMLRAFGCAGGDLHAAHFEHARPHYHHAYAAAFAGAEGFAREYTGLEFAAGLLDRPHLHCNPSLHGLVQSQAELSLAQLSAPTCLIDSLRIYLRSQALKHVPDMQAAARAFGLSERTLRRRLAEEGYSYRSVTQELQRERACTMVRDPSRSLQAIAGALGFSDPACFHRAFKRWTGRTPSDYRESWSKVTHDGRPRLHLYP